MNNIDNFPQPEGIILTTDIDSLSINDNNLQIYSLLCNKNVHSNNVNSIPNENNSAKEMITTRGLKQMKCFYHWSSIQNSLRLKAKNWMERCMLFPLAARQRKNYDRTMKQNLLHQLQCCTKNPNYILLQYELGMLLMVSLDALIFIWKNNYLCWWKIICG